MLATEIKPQYDEIFTMAPIRPFPDEPEKIFRILRTFGYSLDSIASEARVDSSIVGKFIHRKSHSPKVALWFERKGIYLDREYPDPNRSAKTILERITVDLPEYKLAIFRKQMNQRQTYDRSPRKK
ncbi:hypothetical protein [Leptospira idonii]|uniref:Uncharacterized protein n=1 Tax=Leptospira idonii TaxID=1193500 RepID=A0A4R9M6L2_9LEPT|nr:hypothetical protein [Leptospira idonii]TGN20799.1 hypothetical protein EHS15_01820 [Leptospira idonii]